MKGCIESSSSTAVCTACGARPETLHLLLFQRGTYCPGCCPACAPKPATPRLARTEQPAAAPQQSRPRARDPFYLGDRREAQSDFAGWVPYRPDWLKRQ
jgi:hypothetical protein